MKKGFTLMELMVVMVILGILVTVGLASYKSVQMKSRDSKRKSDLKSIASGLNLYLLDNDDYPTADPSDGGQIKACGSSASVIACVWGIDQLDNSSKDKPTTIYMVKLPKDPSSNFSYKYIRSGLSQFQLYAHLENSQDSDYSANIVAKNISCGSALCNYGIASSNTTP